MKGSIRAIVPIALCLLASMVPLARADWAQDGVFIYTRAIIPAYAAIAADAAGGVIVTWHDDRNGNWDIYSQKLNAWGILSWKPDGNPVCTAIRDQLHPGIVSAGAGGAIIAWLEERYECFYIYAQRVNAGGGLGGDQWWSYNVPICTFPGHHAAGDHVEPMLISDGADGAIVMWIDGRNWGADIYAQRVDCLGVVQWETNGVAVSLMERGSFDPVTVSDDAGGVIVAWRGSPTAGVISCDIYAQHVDSSGAIRWGDGGLALCTAPEQQWNLKIVSDCAGGAIAMWIDGRDGNWDIYAQRVNAAGQIQWEPDGIAVRAGIGDQQSSAILSDGAGGAIVIWTDYTGDANLFAQRISASGEAQWAADGVAICTAPGIQAGPTLVSDGADGAIITWNDYRNGNWDIFAQRVNGSGETQWATDGVAICDATWDQCFPEMVSDGAEGAIVLFEDRSSEDIKIYGTRIDANGFSPPTAADAQAVISGLRQNYPNPFNPNTRIVFELSTPGPVSLRIYDASGRFIRELANDERPKGRYEAIWDGRDARGNAVASGIYFYRLDAGIFKQTRKMVLVR